MSVSPFTLVVNPHAAAGRSRAHLKVIESALREANASFTTVETKSRGHATTLVRNALKDGTAGIACIGGDGTMHEVVNGFFSDDGDSLASDAWLAPLPCGTGGDFRRTLGIPKDPAAMTERMLDAKPRPVDVGWLTYTTEDGRTGQCAFINIVSFGVSGEIVRRVNESPKWLGGKLTFGLATARATVGYKPSIIRIEVDGVELLNRRSTTVAMANGRYFGGGMEIAPEARIDDGQLNLIAIPEQSVTEQLRYARRLYDGRVLSVPGVKHAIGTEFRAEATGDDRVLIEADGEALGQLPMSARILPQALKLRA